MCQKTKIFILGSIAGGKTRLAHRLSHHLAIPLVQVDRIEFNFDLSKKPIEITRRELLNAIDRDSWVLDGHGPLDLLPNLMQQSDAIILIDLPFYRHWFWLLKRQLTVFLNPRSELPAGAREWTWAHHKKLFQTLKKQQTLMKPELIRILYRSEYRDKLVHIQSLHELNHLHRNPELLNKFPKTIVQLRKDNVSSV